MREEKKKFLKSYLMQESKIKRLEQMISLNPKNKKEYKKQISNSINLRYKIEENINAVDEPILCELLIQKYILGKTLEEIGYSLNYSKRHIERLHIKALEKIEI